MVVYIADSKPQYSASFVLWIVFLLFFLKDTSVFSYLQAFCKSLILGLLGVQSFKLAAQHPADSWSPAGDLLDWRMMSNPIAVELQIPLLAMQASAHLSTSCHSTKVLHRKNKHCCKTFLVKLRGSERDETV